MRGNVQSVQLVLPELLDVPCIVDCLHSLDLLDSQGIPLLEGLRDLVVHSGLVQDMIHQARGHSSRTGNHPEHGESTGRSRGLRAGFHALRGFLQLARASRRIILSALQLGLQPLHLLLCLSCLLLGSCSLRLQRIDLLLQILTARVRLGLSCSRCLLRLGSLRLSRRDCGLLLLQLRLQLVDLLREIGSLGRCVSLSLLVPLYFSLQ
mmetsp:Transcript_22889/g.50255  ORF Transcript_22889/g.50255 Transcript_22889/m.50255 type:complete len:208 (+) Transcript_22889:807-1430(+)